MRRPPPNGFSLVELAIVLVIIGLIVGGVLVGRDLIANATIRQIASQIGKYETAVNAFRNKYHCLPGDCAKASDFGLSDPACPDPYNWSLGTEITFAGCNGNGNGKLDPNDFNAYTPENLGFWYHLSQAGLIEGGFDGKTPQATDYVNPKFGVSAPATALRNVGIMIWYGYNCIGCVYVDPIPFQLTPSEAYKLDSLLDDGYPVSGKVYAAWTIFSGCIGSLMTTPKTYLLTNNKPGCGLYVTLPGYTY